MKAKQNTSGINFYSKLPSIYKSENLNVAGGFYRLSTEIHESEGFFDVIRPEIDYDVQEIGEIYFDEVNRVFTYPVLEKVLPTLEEAKAIKIMQLKSAVKRLYQSIQWYLEMLRANDEVIPSAVSDKMALIRTKFIEEKATISSIDNVVDVIKYQLPLEAIASLQEQLDAIE